MKRQLLRFVFLVLVTVVAAPAFSADQSGDETEIRKVVAATAETWNRHDMKANANLYAEDADVVNVVSWWWKGRALIEKKATEAHACLFKESRLTNNEVAVGFLTSDVAVVHVRWSMVGHKKPDGTPGEPRKGIATLVMQKQGSHWLIAAFHNTDSIPEVPFPMGTPKQ